MSRNPHHDPSDALDELPPGLIADLAELYAGPAVPREIDARVRNDAAAHFARAARKSRPGRLLRWVGGGAAAAAAVGLAIMLLPQNESAPRAMARRSADAPAAAPAPFESPVASAEDIDRNGRVDILDAFAIARALQAQTGRPPEAWDVTGDGTVDQADVDRVAADAVRVTKVATSQRRRRSAGDGVDPHADVATVDPIGATSGGTIR